MELSVPDIRIGTEAGALRDANYLPIDPFRRCTLFPL